jgi:hypothetical protein
VRGPLAHSDVLATLLPHLHQYLVPHAAVSSPAGGHLAGTWRLAWGAKVALLTWQLASDTTELEIVTLALDGT